MARINGKLTALAYVGDDLGIEWLDKTIVNEEVRTALETFVSELEKGKLLRRKGGHGKVTFVDIAMDPKPGNESVTIQMR